MPLRNTWEKLWSNSIFDTGAEDHLCRLDTFLSITSRTRGPWKNYVIDFACREVGYLFVQVCEYSLSGEIMLKLTLHLTLKCLCSILVIVTTQQSDSWLNWLSSVNIFLLFYPGYLFMNLISTLNFSLFFLKCDSLLIPIFFNA